MHTKYCALINIYSRIVIQLNMYVKIITSSGLSNYHIFGFCARTASGCVSLWPMLEIFRKSTYLPEVVVSSAGSSTTRAARHKWKKKKKNRSRIYDLGVVPTRGNKMDIQCPFEYLACVPKCPLACRKTSKTKALRPINIQSLSRPLLKLRSKSMQSLYRLQITIQQHIIRL